MERRDPWLWSVAEVVANLCDSTSLYNEAGCEPQMLPYRTVLGHYLNQHAITGQNLLTTFYNGLLSKTIKIQIPGAENSLLKIINFLRSNSNIYRRNFPSANTSTQPARSITWGTGMQRPPGRIFEPKRAELVPTASLSTSMNLVQAQPTHIMEESPLLGQDWNYLQNKWKDGEDIVIDLSKDNNQSSEIQHGSADVNMAGVVEDEEDDEGEGEDTDEDSLEAYQIEPSKPPARGHKSTLDDDRVTEIINEQIARFEEEWYPGKGWTHDNHIASDARELWLEAESVGERLDLIEITRRNVDYYTNRLNVLSTEIATLGGPWTQVNALRLQCRSLATTVEVLLQEEWELSVYQMPSAPSPSATDDEMNPSSPPQIHPPSTSTATPQKAPQVLYPSTAPPAPPMSTPRHTTSRRVSVVIDLDAPEDMMEIDNIREAHGSTNVMTSQAPTTITQPSIINANQNDARTPARASFQTPKIEPRSPSHSQPSSQRPIHSSNPTTPSQRSHHRPHQRRPSPPSTPSTAITINLNDYPESASISTIQKWPWPILLATQDRKRIIMKALSTMPAADLALIRTRLTLLKRSDIFSELSLCVTMLLERSDRLPGVLPRDVPKILKLTRLFLCWWLAADFVSDEKRMPSKVELQGLVREIKQGARDPGVFYDWTRWVLANTFSEEALREPARPSQAEVIEISSDEEGEVGATVVSPMEAVVTTPRAPSSMARRGSGGFGFRGVGRRGAFGA
ncbi:hypothetical protein BU24DRAFT_425137 [Aaosphaeria arxii CBS 175.79]|uniref:DUF7607 domain-containing protein n=1 Tax=Aaosphaeria arxii CBS 175.79 TaxID=1450172 RepID=A0A6A5XHY8_9PLEO|nr:uncharacterized protein BU24DRAFT_425137 [Aaosphaeria arxii CBS 175.79]KAF2012486.1 hypothetical protein BU24DRAFT_425137 [Aaosphaeria arxii CBS 175.79]